MRKWTGRILTAVSLVLLAGTAGMWVRSQCAADVVDVRRISSADRSFHKSSIKLHGSGIRCASQMWRGELKSEYEVDAFLAILPPGTLVDHQRDAPAGFFRLAGERGGGGFAWAVGP
jgi:hypothetical protein